MVVLEIQGQKIYLDGYLKKKLDNIKAIINKNYDCVFLIDGKERTGKSTLGQIAAYYLSDGNFQIENIVKDGQDALDKIESFPDKSVLMIDEGSLVFSSKDALRKEQKKLMQVMDIVGQKNMIFIVILPCFFDLSKTIALRRSKFLLHVYSDDNLDRGRFAYYGEKRKNKLYHYGKKNFDSYAKPHPNFIGRFTEFNPFGENYKDIKKKTLIAALKKDNEPMDRKTKYNEMRTMKVILAMEKYPFPFPVNFKEKAKMIGIDDEYYIVALSKLRKQGLITTYADGSPVIKL